MPTPITSSSSRSFYSGTEIKYVLFPLLRKILTQYHKNKTTIIGIQGGQGTGKTTLARYLQEQLHSRGYAVESFSIDDFYTSYAERKKLAKKYPRNPFYQISRGMPGTHRVKDLLHTLQNIKKGKNFTIPIFDKSLKNAAGDIAGERKVAKRPDFVLFEGWCVGIPLVSTKEVAAICKKNKIPLQEIDPTLQQSKVVVQFIRQYQPLWKYIDYLVMLKPTSSDLHLTWRLQQEQELQQQKGAGMDKKEVEHFVNVYLPFTYVCYEKINADTVLMINRNHHFYRVEYR